MPTGLLIAINASQLIAQAAGASVAPRLRPEHFANVSSLAGGRIVEQDNSVVLRPGHFANASSLAGGRVAQEAAQIIRPEHFANASSFGGGEVVPDVPMSWHTVFQPGSVTLTSSSAALTLRNIIPASLLIAGSKLRFTFRGNTNIGRAFVGLKAASGDAYDFAATPTQILFSGGAGVNIGTGVDQVSDEVAFVQDGTVALIVSIEKTAGNQLRNLALTGASRYFIAGSTDGATVNTSGYDAGVTNSIRVLMILEIWAPT